MDPAELHAFFLLTSLRTETGANRRAFHSMLLSLFEARACMCDLRAATSACASSCRGILPSLAPKPVQITVGAVESYRTSHAFTRSKLGEDSIPSDTRSLLFVSGHLTNEQGVNVGNVAGQPKEGPHTHDTHLSVR